MAYSIFKLIPHMKWLSVTGPIRAFSSHRKTSVTIKKPHHESFNEFVSDAALKAAKKRIEPFNTYSIEIQLNDRTI